MKDIIMWLLGIAVTTGLGFSGWFGKTVMGYMKLMLEELRKITSINVQHEERIKTLERITDDHETRIRNLE